MQCCTVPTSMVLYCTGWCSDLLYGVMYFTVPSSVVFYCVPIVLQGITFSVMFYCIEQCSAVLHRQVWYYTAPVGVVIYCTESCILPYRVV